MDRLPHISFRFPQKSQFSFCVLQNIFLLSAHTNFGGDHMSPKELNYIEDALAHEKFLKSQCDEAVKNLQDPELKQQVQQLSEKHQQLFDNFYHLV